LRERNAEAIDDRQNDDKEKYFRLFKKRHSQLDVFSQGLIHVADELRMGELLSQTQSIFMIDDASCMMHGKYHGSKVLSTTYRQIYSYCMFRVK
jgi:hypothetical protein